MEKKSNGLVIFLIVVVVLVSILYMRSRSSKNSNVMVNSETNSNASNKTTNETSATKETSDTMQKNLDTFTVKVTENGFEPSTVTIKAGTKVVWINNSGQDSNVSSAFHPTHLVYPPLNLGSFSDGDSVSLIFDKPGTYKYHNHLDPSQFGEIVVE